MIDWLSWRVSIKHDSINLLSSSPSLSILSPYFPSPSYTLPFSTLSYPLPSPYKIHTRPILSPNHLHTLSIPSPYSKTSQTFSIPTTTLPYPQITSQFLPNHIHTPPPPLFLPYSLLYPLHTLLFSHPSFNFCYPLPIILLHTSINSSNSKPNYIL